MNTEAIIAIVSLGITGLVSVLAVIVPALTEYHKGKCERVFATIERIQDKSRDLSLYLARLRNRLYLEQIGDAEVNETFIALRANHDAWEIAIWASLGKQERKLVKEMRLGKYGRDYLNVATDAGKRHIMEVIDEVVTISCSAIQRLEDSTAWFRCFKGHSRMQFSHGSSELSEPLLVIRDSANGTEIRTSDSSSTKES